jgi:hypothetical protein
MRIFRVCVLGLLLSVVSASAQVAIWQVKFNFTTSGGSGIVHSKHTGYFVVDMAGKTAQWLDASGTSYQLINNPSNVVQTISTSAHAYILAVTVPLGEIGGLTLKGHATPMKLGSTNVFYTPRVFTAEGASQQLQNGQPFLQEYTGTATLDTKDTSDANGLLEPIDTVIANLETRLQQEGYAQQTQQ